MSSLLIPLNMMKLDEHPVPCLMKHNVVAPSVEMRASEQYFDSVLIQFTTKNEILQERQRRLSDTILIKNHAVVVVDVEIHSWLHHQGWSSLESYFWQPFVSFCCFTMEWNIQTGLVLDIRYFSLVTQGCWSQVLSTSSAILFPMWPTTPSDHLW